MCHTKRQCDRSSDLSSLTARQWHLDGELTRNRVLFEGVTKGDVESAKAHFQFMLEHGKHPTKYHYDVLIESYSHAGDMVGTKMTLVSARKAGYARLGQSAYAEWVFRAMVFRRVRPDVAAVDAKARTYLMAGHVKKARSQLLWFWPFYGRFSPELHNASTRVLAKEFRELGTPQSNPFTDKPDVRKKITRVRLGRRWKECKTEKLTMDDMV